MAERRQTKGPWFGRGGSVLVVVTLFLPVLLAFTVATVDVGYFYAQKSRVQAAADMACLSALGNVTWNGEDVAAERSQMTSIFQNTLVQNGYPADFLGTPTFSDAFVRNGNQERIEVVTTIPVRTFFWDFVRPGDPNLAIQIRSAAGVTYDTSWEAISPNWGVYALEVLNYQGVPGNDSYKSSDGWDPSMGGTPLTKYGDIDVGSGDEVVFGGGVSVSGNVYATSVVTLNGTVDVLGDVQGEIITDNGDVTITGDINEGEPGPTLQFDPLPIPSSYVTLTDPISPADAIKVYKLTLPAVLPESDPAAWYEVALSTCYDATTKKLDIRNNEKVVLRGGGDYVFGEMLMVGGYLEVDEANPITADAFTSIYATDKVQMAGNIKSYDDFRLIQTSDEDVSIQANATFYADIYAPNADVDVQAGADVFGRIVGKTVDMSGGASFYFDKDLPAWGGQQSTPPQVIVPCHLLAN